MVLSFFAETALMAVSRLRGVKDGERCGLAPKTVDFDW